MKTNNKKKIVVSVLALSMGACLAGSISGSVAWYQYSTRTSAAIAGTSAGTSRQLWIAQEKTGDSPTYLDGDWKQHLPLGTQKFRPTSIYKDAQNNIQFVDHPVYKSPVLPPAVQNEATDEILFKKTYSFVFKCVDSSSSSSSENNPRQVAKSVYLTKLNIVSATNATKDISPAVRVLVDGDGTNDYIIGLESTTNPENVTTTSGYLDLNNNTEDDKDGYDANDEKGSKITYRNAINPTDETDPIGTSYTYSLPSAVLVNDTNPYTFTNTTNKLLTTTTESGVSAAVKITVWIEGWQKLGTQPNYSSLWDSSWLEQNFEIQMQFACEADR